MDRERFKRQGKGTFFGDMICERIVARDRFLRQLNEVVSQQRFTERLVELYGGQRGGEAGLQTSPPCPRMARRQRVRRLPRIVGPGLDGEQSGRGERTQKDQSARLIGRETAV